MKTLGLCLLITAAAFGQAKNDVPRAADGKPDFNGTFQWPTYLPGQEHGRSSATTFDRKNFAPLKPGGEPFLECELFGYGQVPIAETRIAPDVTA